MNKFYQDLSENWKNLEEKLTKSKMVYLENNPKLNFQGDPLW